jgi:8-oxo-dGTP diphosphatase
MKRVSSIILINEGEILMQLRDNKPGIPYPDCWSFIGGQIEKGETPLQAIERECLEELGIKPANIKFIGRIFIPPYELREDDEIFVFRGETDKKAYEIRLTEGQRVEYFSFEKIQNLRIPYQLKSFLLENKNKLF